MARRKPADPSKAEPRTDESLREANRRLLVAALEADEERDAQAALATAMRTLLATGEEAERGRSHEIELLRAITDNVSAALFLLDGQGHPLFINPAGVAMFGHALSEIEGAHVHHAVHHHYPDGRPFPIEDCAVANAISRRTPLRGHQDIFVRKDGTLVPVRCDVGVLELAGQRVGAVLEVRDRSSEVRAEEARRDFVALIAHDLRTPLASVQGEQQLLQRRLERAGDSDVRVVRGLESIGRGARRMDAMIQELLEASRLESGVVPLRMAPIDISGLVAQVVGQLPGDARERVTIAAEPTVVAFADPQRIERVIDNLLSNAVKYSAPNAAIRIDVRRGDGEAIVAVVDRGRGVAPDQLARLFQRFVRLEGAPADPGGLGLGLYIARLIVEAHGGRVWAESEVGRGTTIGFTVPLNASDDGTVQRAS